MLTLALPFPAIDPVLIEIGPFAIRWYALAYIAGLVLGWQYVVRLVQQPGWGGLPRTDIDDLAGLHHAGRGVGGRLGYVLFYRPGYYLSSPLGRRGLARRHVVPGGLSASSRRCAVRPRRGVRRWRSATVCASAPIGLFGRHRQLHQRRAVRALSDVPWAAFPHGGPSPHPSQRMRPGLEGLVLFGIMTWFAWRPREPDPTAVLPGILLIGYGVARILVELFREPDPHLGFLIGGLTMGQPLSLPLIVIGAVLVVRSHGRGARGPEPALSGLDSELGAAIRRDGPLSVACFISLALHHPTSGYYRQRDPLGPEGDFVTAPELSQAFGEVLGAWLAQAWLDLGRPAPFRSSSSGPGAAPCLPTPCAPRARSRVSTPVCAFTWSRPARGCGRCRRRGSPSSTRAGTQGSARCRPGRCS